MKTYNPVKISTSDQRCFNVVDETKSDLGFSTLYNNVDTTSVSVILQNIFNNILTIRLLIN